MHPIQQTDWRNVDALKLVGDRCVPKWKIDQTRRRQNQVAFVILGAVLGGLYCAIGGIIVWTAVQLMGGQ
jgi:hypothetical protein